MKRYIEEHPDDPVILVGVEDKLDEELKRLLS